MVEMTLPEQVYDCLLGQTERNITLNWVENIFTDGSAYDHNYGEVLDAYERLCQRLGTGDEDADVEIIINSMLDNEQIVALKMFEYGMKYAKLLNSDTSR